MGDGPLLKEQVRNRLKDRPLQTPWPDPLGNSRRSPTPGQSASGRRRGTRVPRSLPRRAFGGADGV
jgi:hypothetical protein